MDGMTQFTEEELKKLIHDVNREGLKGNTIDAIQFLRGGGRNMVAIKFKSAGVYINLSDQSETSEKEK